MVRSGVNPGNMGNEAISDSDSVTTTPEVPDPTPINMLAETLDSRVTYIGPAHTVYDLGGNLLTSNENEWPLEYQNGIAVGRHEPEDESTNYALDSAATNINEPGVDGNWMYSQGTTVTVAASNVSQFPTISVELRKINVAVYNETDAAFLVPDNDPGTTTDWVRVVQPFTNDTESQLRWYTQRENSSSYLYEKAPAVPAGVCVASVFRRLTNANMQSTAPQLEQGTIATSPIFNNADEQNTRPSASAFVTNTDNATRIVIHYSDNSTVTVDFVNDQAAIPLASLDWSARYITQITFIT